jgi:hypothetical protein
MLNEYVKMTVGQIARLGINLVLLAAVGLHCGLALMDHHAADYDPWHDHVVLRVGDEHAASDAAHRHDAGRAHEHDPVVARATHPHDSAEATDADNAQVVSIPDHTHSSGLSLFGVAMDYLFALDTAQPLETPSGATKAPISTFLAPNDIALSPPEPPPRLPLTVTL